MQVDPIKPTLKAPGTKSSKLKCDELLSKIAFNYYLRRYNKEIPLASMVGRCRLTLSNPR